MELFGAKVLVVNMAKIEITANLLQRFLHLFRPKNSSDCKEVLLNEIGGQGRLQQLQKSSLVSGGVLFLLPSQDVMSYLKSPAFRKYSIFF